MVICLDGSADEHLDSAITGDLMPNLVKRIANGWRGIARAAMPTFTSVNNSSSEEVMMNSAKLLRVETIVIPLQRSGREVAVLTAKDYECFIWKLGASSASV